MNHIIIIGFMGSGKGSVGRKVAEALSLPLYDTDKMVAEKLKMSSADVYTRFGDRFYRAEETYVLSELLKKNERAVIVLGSALPLCRFNDRLLQALGSIYWLKISKKTVLERIAKSKKHDWLKKENIADTIGSMLKERNEAYERIADVTLEADEHSVKELCRQITEEALKADDAQHEKMPRNAGAADKKETVKKEAGKAKAVRKTAEKSQTASVRSK